MTVLFNDDTSINVPAGETVTRQRLEGSDQLLNPMLDNQLTDQPVSEPTLPSTPSLSLVSSTNAVRLLVDPTTGLAFVQESTKDPLRISRADDYFNGDVPLVRGTATLVAAARDDLGRMRVLDVSEWGAFAWILDENGLFQAEEGPADSTLSSKEILFQTDLMEMGFWVCLKICEFLGSLPILRIRSVHITAGFCLCVGIHFTVNGEHAFY